MFIYFSMNVRKSSPQICTSVWLWAACCHTLEMPVLARVTSKSHHRIQLQTDGVCGEGLSSLSSVPAKHHRSDHRTQSSATTNTCRFACKQSFWDMTWLFLIDWFWLNGMFFFRWAQFTVSLIQNALKNSGMFAYRLRISELLICGCTMSSKVLLILELILFLLLLLLLFLLY